MNQHDAPAGTLAYLGHPDNRRLIYKADNGEWYRVVPQLLVGVDEEEFRAGWYRLIPARNESSTGRSYRVGDPDPTPDDPPEDTSVQMCQASLPGVHRGSVYHCTWWMDNHPVQHVAGTGDRIVAVWE